ncbi:MAG TPA: NADH-quinone oxidoreductase subunit NuoH [Phycisphaerae bacterium]|nr:NADH-quinone oxidoreductase subunit NuoH [Phycisphaerae bacterium]HOI56098.1 NADH-quinone oxidoreductase subunit NuoH [Phycisphaerae bacterium]
MMIAINLVKVLIVFAFVQAMAGLTLWAERRLSALMQDRWGPNRLGPFGLLQPLADSVKLLLKEDITPQGVDRLLYYLAPAMSLAPALMTVAVVPFGEPVTLFGQYVVPLQVADIHLGILFILAVGSLEIYGIVFGAWASNNKYSLLGGVRSVAQMLSYELFMGGSLVGVVMLTGSLRLNDIVASQQHLLWGWLPAWNLFRQPLGFVVFLVAAFAETNRLPFDLPESEQELVGGYHTEYSSMKFVMFFIAEYAAVFTMSALLATVFLGGYGLPGLSVAECGPVWWLPVAQAAVFLTKTLLFVLLFITVRWSLSRLRYDQLMRLGWKVMLPLALLNIVVTGTLMFLWRTTG